MIDDKKSTESKRSKIIPTTAIIIVIILSSIFIWNNLHSESEKNDIEELVQLEFIIDIVDCPWDLKNKSFYFQLKNVSDNTFNYTAPRIGKNLNFFIVAANGTRYSYAGPITEELPYWKNLSSGEIEDGYIWFGFKIFYLHASRINYTHWQNSSTGESWLFQPGTYEIYGMFKSYEPNNKYIKNVVIGVWYSHTVALSIT